MSFDGFFLHHMTAELRERVLYGRIQKVNQPFERELVLTIRNNRQNYKLLLSAHPVFGRIQTTKAELPNPQNPNITLSSTKRPECRDRREIRGSSIAFPDRKSVV